MKAVNVFNFTRLYALPRWFM